MGIYLNPGAEQFEEIVRSEIYVDKTGLLRYTNSIVNTMQKSLMSGTAFSVSISGIGKDRRCILIFSGTF